MIEVNELSKTYRIHVKKPGLKGAFESLVHSRQEIKTALDHVTFQVREGSAVACIGENGAGKSTLIKLLIGILTPTQGSVRVFGGDPKKSGQEYLRQIGVVFGQKSGLWTDIPVIESYRAVQVLYKVDKREFESNFEKVVELLELSPVLNSPPRKLSLGQRMKADIGMVFLHGPRLLYLDEPTIGLDINVKHTIRTFLRQMNQEKKVSIFLTSHDLDDIDEICDDTIVLSGGRLVYTGSLNDLKHHYVHDKIVKVVGKKLREIDHVLPNVRAVQEGRTTKIVYRASEYSSQQMLGALSACFQIEDITIQEPDIDEVVSRIFDRGI